MPIVAYVYIIESTSTGSFYIGYTSDLTERILAHQSGDSNWTRNKGPWVLRYYEEFTEDTAARSREIQLKKARNKKYFQWLIENGPGRSVNQP